MAIGSYGAKTLIAKCLTVHSRSAFGHILSHTHTPFEPRSHRSFSKPSCPALIAPPIPLYLCKHPFSRPWPKTTSSMKPTRMTHFLMYLCRVQGGHWETALGMCL